MCLALHAIAVFCLLFSTIQLAIGLQCGIVNLKAAPWSSKTPSPPTQEHIPVIGGEEPQKNDMPWVIALYVNRNYICTGSLVASNYVLTAKHCLAHIKQPIYGIYVGYGNVDKNKMKYVRVVNVTDHPSGDISILQLWGKVQQTPVCLPVSYKPGCQLGKTMVVAGLGNHVAADYNPVGVKNGSVVNNIPDDPAKSVLWTKIKQLDNPKCGLVPLYYDSRKFCAGGLGHGTMGGDSGGPVMKVAGKHVVQVGVTSEGYTEAVNHRLYDAGIYVNVGFYAQWIASTTNYTAQFRHIPVLCKKN